MNDPAKLIEIFQALLAQLEQTISGVPKLMEDGRTDSLSNKIQTYQTQIARVKNALRKQQDHERHKREVEKKNRENARKTISQRRP